MDSYSNSVQRLYFDVEVVRFLYFSRVLTRRGYVESERPHVPLDKIQHIAILMAEREDGPFEMNIDWIRAVTSP